MLVSLDFDFNKLRLFPKTGVSKLVRFLGLPNGNGLKSSDFGTSEADPPAVKSDATLGFDKTLETFSMARVTRTCSCSLPAQYPL